MSVEQDKRDKLCKIYTANSTKRYLWGAAALVQRVFCQAQYGQLLFPPDELAALEKASAAMTELVATWQRKPGSNAQRQRRKDLREQAEFDAKYPPMVY